MADDPERTHTHPDLGWLGLEQRSPGHWSFELIPSLTRLDGKFYGGTGVAIATAAMEAETGREALWTTVQYVASADTGERLDCRVEVLAGGYRTSQLKVTAAVGDRVVMEALGATGEARTGPLNTQFGEMPQVGEPEDSPAFGARSPFPVPAGNPGWLSITEFREVEGLGRSMALWARMQDRRQTRASLGFLADMVPMGVVRAAGRAGAGTSLDNAIRYGPRPDTDWVLIDLEPYMASGGYLHGGARLWSLDGVLLAVASQTATALLFD